MIISALKSLLKKLPIDFTQNQKYDRQAEMVLKKICLPTSNCIDIGSHKGEFLDLFLKYAPLGKHFAFEPLPSFFEDLKQKYNTIENIYDVALSNHSGRTGFKYVPDHPAYSGIMKREYLSKNEKVIDIEAKVDLLDNIISNQIRIDFIKIDVEGGELQVLEGAKETLKRNKPIVVFEHGLGASEYYSTTPEKVYTLFYELGFSISTMKNWLQSGESFTLQEFQNQFLNKINYYFIAFPRA